MQNAEAITKLAQELELQSSDENAELMRQRIIEKVRVLILHDMSKLTALLYRVDVDENKLRSVLEQNKDLDTAPIITDLLLERQALKIKSRREYTRRDQNIDESEKW